jgi:hypothetical protein
LGVLADDGGEAMRIDGHAARVRSELTREEQGRFVGIDMCWAMHNVLLHGEAMPFNSRGSPGSGTHGREGRIVAPRSGADGKCLDADPHRCAVV